MESKKNNWVEFLKEFHKHKIEKSGFNKFNKYPYYRLEDIERAIVETQIKTGFNLTLVKQTPFFMEGLEYMRFEYEFNGCERTFEFMFRHDNTHKNLIQSSGSTSTYGHRYTLMRILGIAEDVDDPDNDKNQSKANQSTKKTKKVENQAPVKKSVLKTIKIEPKEVVKETEQPEPTDMAKQIRKSVFANKTKKLNDIKITNKEGE